MLNPPITALLPSLSMPQAGSLGKIVDSDIVQFLKQNGIKVRIKDHRGFLEPCGVPPIEAMELILSTPRRRLVPGRRLATICSSINNLQPSTESLDLTTYGPKQSIFRKQNILFEGKVPSYQAVIEQLECFRSLFP